MSSAVASVADAPHPARHVAWSRVVGSTVRTTIPALPLDLYRVAAGALLFAGGVQSLAGYSDHLALGMTRALAMTALGSLIVAGVWPRASALALLVTLAWAGHVIPLQGMDDYLTASTCFWLACLPVGRTLRFPWRRDALVQAGRWRVPDFSRRLFVLWVSSLCFFGVLCDVAWGAWLPQRASRALTGLLLAFLLWPSRSHARWAGALLFAALVFGLLFRVGPSPGVLFLLVGALLVWAPELAGRADALDRASGDAKAALDASGVLAASMLVLLALSILPWEAPPTRMSAAILKDVGLAVDFTWRELLR